MNKRCIIIIERLLLVIISNIITCKSLSIIMKRRKQDSLLDQIYLGYKDERIYFYFYNTGSMQIKLVYRRKNEIEKHQDTTILDQ